MDVSKIYSLARTYTATDSTQLPDATCQDFSNIIYHDLEKEITTRINEDFFYNEWVTDTVIWQREYVLPAKSWTTSWVKKLLSVSLKMKSDADYTKLYENRLTNLEYDVNKFSWEQEFYYIADNSVFLYPIPTEVITAGVKLYWVASLWDIVTGWAESTVKIPVEYHDLIPLGMKYLIYQSRGMINEKNDALLEYNNAKERMIWTLSDRNLWPNISEMPNLSIYK